MGNLIASPSSAKDLDNSNVIGLIASLGVAPIPLRGSYTDACEFLAGLLADGSLIYCLADMSGNGNTLSIVYKGAGTRVYQAKGIINEADARTGLEVLAALYKRTDLPEGYKLLDSSGWRAVIGTRYIRKMTFEHERNGEKDQRHTFQLVFRPGKVLTHKLDLVCNNQKDWNDIKGQIEPAMAQLPVIIV